MGKIVKFPKATSAPRAGELDAGRIKAVSLPRVSLAGVLAKLWAVVRLPLFLVLYWLRGPVLFVCNLVSVFGFLTFLVGLWISSKEPQYRSMVWGVGGMSFGAFAVRWAYDAMLMRLSPDTLIFTY
jgi:hypothetical protein